MFLLLTLNIFRPSSSVPIVDFEQVSDSYYRSEIYGRTLDNRFNKIVECLGVKKVSKNLVILSTWFSQGRISRGRRGSSILGTIISMQ